MWENLKWMFHCVTKTADASEENSSRRCEEEKNYATTKLVCRISGSPSSCYAQIHSQPELQRNTSPSSSGLKNKPSKIIIPK
jgi:hypothetical protein